MTEHRFTVRGSWPFPFDMLRYDCCYPATETDSAVLERVAGEKLEAGVVDITLATQDGPPTPRRWESRLWLVLPCLALLLALTSAASAQSLRMSCTHAGRSSNCVMNYGPAVNPYVIHVAPDVETDEDRAAREEHEAAWVDFCKPRVVPDSEGVRRYVYAKAGCDHGRTQ